MNPNPEPLTPIDRVWVEKAMSTVCQDELRTWVEMYFDGCPEVDDKPVVTEESLYEFVLGMWSEVPKTDGISYHNDWVYQMTANFFCDHFEIPHVRLDS
jgi:hypothetical protein